MDFQEIARRLDERSDSYQRINPTQFQKMIANIKGAKIATLMARTVPSGMRKTNNPFFGDCYKIQRVNVVINPSDTGYKDSVNRQLEREGKVPNFEVQPRAFGTKLGKKPIIAHVTKEGDGKFYLWTQTAKVLYYFYQNTNGDLLDKIEVEKFIPVKNEGGRQGTDKPTTVRNFTMENIVGLVMDGQGYVIANNQ